MLSILANIADLLAAAGVIASLLFLAIELRVQNRETELKTWRELQMALADFKTVTNDPHMADLVERGHTDYAALSDAEKRAFGLFMEQGVQAIGLFRQHTGTVPKQFEHLHSAVRNTLLDHVATSGARAWWAESKPRGRFLPSTAELIDELQAPDAKPTGPHV